MTLATFSSITAVPHVITLEGIVCDTAYEYAHKYAEYLAAIHHNPVKWLLDYDELYGEMLLEYAKSINVYLYTRPRPEYYKLLRSMMWYRVKELKAKTFGTHRDVEYSAHCLDEDYDWMEISSGVKPFFLFEVLENLSPLARQMVDMVVHPTDEMEKALARYIEYRNGLYVHGAGVNGIPPKIFAEVLGESISTIKEAYQEIGKALNDEEFNIMSVQIRDTHFSGKLMTWKDVKELKAADTYSKWSIIWLRNQAEFRGIDTEGMKRRDMVYALRDHDKDNGVASDVPVDAKSKVEEEKKIEKVEEKKIDEKKVEDVQSSDVSVHEVEGDVFSQMLAAMRNGETLTVTKIGTSQWQFHLESNEVSKKSKTPSADGSELIPTKPIVDKSAPFVEKHKKNSEKWSGLVLNPAYVEFKKEIKAMGNNFFETAREEGAEWEDSEDRKITHMRAVAALVTKRGIEKYRPEFRTRNSRKAITL